MPPSSMSAGEMLPGLCIGALVHGIVGTYPYLLFPLFFPAPCSVPWLQLCEEGGLLDTNFPLTSATAVFEVGGECAGGWGEWVSSRAGTVGTGQWALLFITA